MNAPRTLAAVVVLVAIAAGLWWLAVHPRQQLAAERAAHAETRAAHAQVLQRIAEGTAEVARKAAAARDEYERAKSAALAEHEQEVRDAYERGRAAAAGIAAGTVRVREVWRDRECPAAAAGPGAEPAGGPAAVADDRAAAIGRVLGIGGEADATYALAYARLRAAQGLLNTCYEEPAE